MPPAEPDLVTVARLGAEGDGVAALPDGTPLYLPFTLPGERVRPGALTRRGKGLTAAASEIVEPSPDRIPPACRHFGVCGGCVAQHLADPAYAAWKHGRVAAVLQRLGYTHPLPPISRTPPFARRRMDLALRRDQAGITVGLHTRAGAGVIDMQECPILHPDLFRIVDPLRQTLRSLQALRREGSAIVNLLDTGPDLLLRTDADLTAPDRTRLAALAASTGIPRISWARGPTAAPEPAAQSAPPQLAFSGRPTRIPPGAFLQASREGEAAIQAAVLAALPARIGKPGIIELYAGCGTLTHALATRAPVAAYEGDPAAIAALRGAANPRVTPHHRDLARQPLQPRELAGAVIVLDPPFAGAGPQMAPLAQSGRPIIYVSCNPAALERDATVLLDAGYRPTSAAVIDQFLWSAQVETVIGFTSAPAPRQRLE